jgi:peptide/nickel transport system substrate-binding protein
VKLGNPGPCAFVGARAGGARDDRPMHRIGRAAFLALSLAGAVLAGCGGEEQRSGDAAEGAPASGRQGGVLTMLLTDDVDFIDPGQTYYQLGYVVAYATQRPLFAWEPGDSETPRPDLAEAAPDVSADGRTVTVRIRRGVRFSPPVDREVTSADVKYAIERGFFGTVANGYAGNYFGDVAGAREGARPGTRIAGIETPDPRTIRFRLRRATGGVLAGALALPLSAPVPREYAAPLDRRNPSAYGANQVATGPYMIENDERGRAIGYQAGRRIHLVRNPNWDRATDFRPAYVDEVEMPQGNDDPTIASRRVLEGSHLLSGDFTPPPQVLAAASRSRRVQLEIVPGGSIRYVSLNTTVPPLDDPDVRRAISAALDREQLRRVRGGELLGEIPTHMLAPGIPGFDAGGGADGPGADFLAAPGGDGDLAAEYMRRAGYASGRYEGDGELLMVGVSGGVPQRTAEVAQAGLERLGFDVDLRLATQDAMLTRFCGSPGSDVAICPNLSWGKDFADGQTFLGPLFDGDNINPQGNANTAELDDPAINRAIDQAQLLTAPDERAAAWGRVDRMVTEQAAVVPLLWDNVALLRSADVDGVVNRFNAHWDLPFVSLR